MMNPIVQLEVQRLRNTVTRFWTNKTEMRRAALFVLGMGFYLWWNIFRRVGAKKEGFLEAWHWVRFAFPAVLAYFAAMIGAFGRMNRYLARWAAGSWSVLPVEPAGIAVSLMGTMAIMDSAWIVLGLVLSIGLSYVTGLVWWQEFPFLLLGTILLVATASVAKTFSTLILRLGSSRMLQWPNWVLRALGAMLTMIFVQPLVGFWLLAEYVRQSGVPSMAYLSLLIIAICVTALTLAARFLLVRKWSAISASFEIQQTQRRSKETVPLASVIANLWRSPAVRLATLYNLRSEINLQRWGKQMNVGGRRLYMLIPFYLMVLFLITAPYLSSRHEALPIIAVMFAAVWIGMFTAISMPPLAPVYRMLRQLPVPFWDFVRAVAALPWLLSGLLFVVCCIIIGITQPQDAYRWFSIIFVVSASVASLRVFIVAAYPGAQQTAEFIFIAVLGVGGLAGYYGSWIAAVPVVLVAEIYFIRKAAREWRFREEGLNV